MTVSRANPSLLRRADLLVVGGPTHVHGMSQRRSRAAAVDRKPGSPLTLEPEAEGAGLRADEEDGARKSAQEPAGRVASRRGVGAA